MDGGALKCSSFVQLSAAAASKVNFSEKENEFPLFSCCCGYPTQPTRSGSCPSLFVSSIKRAAAAAAWTSAISQSSVVFTLLCAPIIVLYHHHIIIGTAIDGPPPQGGEKISRSVVKDARLLFVTIFFLSSFLKIRCIAGRFQM